MEAQTGTMAFPKKPRIHNLLIANVKMAWQN